ncbi:hypothetical protein [Nocardia abscessus]|nr:hypothetical protein [Nocardia abscessus]
MPGTAITVSVATCDLTSREARQLRRLVAAGELDAVVAATIGASS